MRRPGLKLPLHLASRAGSMVIYAVMISIFTAAIRPASAQEIALTLHEAVEGSKIEIVRLTGRSPAFFEPMILLEARNLTGAPLTVTPQIGSILRSVDSAACDVVLLEAATPVYFDGTSQEPYSFYLYGYCIQPAPTERQFPANTAHYETTGLSTPPAVTITLQRIAERKQQNGFAAQLAVWLAAGVADDLAGLQAALNAYDLSGYQGAVEQLFPALLPVPAAPTAEIAQTVAPPTEAPPTAGMTPPAEVTPTPLSSPPPSDVNNNPPSATPPAQSQNLTPLLLIGALLVSGVMLLIWLLLKSAAKPQAAPTAPAPLDMPSLPQPVTPLRPDSPTSGLGRPADGPRRHIAISQQPRSNTDPISPVTKPGPSTSPRPAPAAKPSPRPGAFVSKTRPSHVKSSDDADHPDVSPSEDKLMIRLHAQKQGVWVKVPAQGGILSRAGADEIQFLELKDAHVSVPHALIQWSREQDAFFIKDLRSESGTLVNNTPIQKEVQIQHHDQIQVGEAVLTFNKTLRELKLSSSSKVFRLIGGSRWIITQRKVEFIALNTVDDLQISAPHAYLEVGQLAARSAPGKPASVLLTEDSQILIRDLNSTNGTFVHERRVPQERLVPDDIIRLGVTDFEVSTTLDFMPNELGPDRRLVKQSLIAVGGMARVYKYKDVQTNELFAVKVPRLGRYRRSDKLGQEYRNAFDNEIRITQQLGEQEAFVRALRLEPVPIPLMPQKVLCLILDYIDGPALSRFVEKGERLDLPSAVEIGWRIANALCHLHKSSWSHCDVKPSNILLDTEGRVYLTDLGIAQQMGQPLPQFRSDGYWPAEATLNARVASTLDIYSLGVVLYELALGQRFEPPGGFKDGSGGRADAEDFLRKQMKELDSASATTVHGEFADIILRCLAPMTERYQAMLEVAADLSLLRTSSPANLQLLCVRFGHSSSD